MTIAVALGELEAAARERGPTAYILTVNERDTPHVVHAEVTIASEGLVLQVGARTVLHARHRPGVSLLYPCRTAADYSLIVDAMASVIPNLKPATSRVIGRSLSANAAAVLTCSHESLSPSSQPFL